MRTPAPETQRLRGALGGRLLVLAVAVALGLVLQKLLRERLDSIGLHSQRDMIAARAELAVLIRAVGLSVFGLTAALGAAIAASCRSPRSAERFPAGVGLALGLLLLAASLAGAGFVWYVGALLLACRAGV